MAPTAKPLLFKLLGGLGLVIGLFGSMYAIFNAAPLLAERDKYVSAYREAAVPPLPKGATDERGPLFDKVADALYARRGVTLPLAAIDVILSMLLFAGCGRALRGQAWGLSAWTLAAAASIPYEVLDAARLTLETRDLAQILGEPASPGVLVVMIQMVLLILYFGVCLVYLRRPQIAALFSASGGAGTRPSA